MKYLETEKKKETQIGKTVFIVTSVYKGNQKFEKLLLDWAVDKTYKTIKN